MARQIFAALILASLTACTPVSAADFVTPAFLLPYATDAAVNDYRPAVNSTGTRIVFERSFFNAATASYDNPTNLYISDLKAPAPVLLAPNFPGSSRPDWCWKNSSAEPDGLIAFTVAKPYVNPGVYITEPSNGTARLVPGSAGHIYPTWFPGCLKLAVYIPGAIPATGDSAALVYGPTVRKVDVATGDFVRSLTGNSLWAGFPGIDRKDSSLIAFAGQQFTSAGYDENFNYVYIANTAGSPPSIKPLDPAATVNRYNPRQQGRAPTFSPDGQWIAFESNRNCREGSVSGNYAIFLQDAQGRTPAQQVTTCSYDAQHAKWYRAAVRGRTLLIASVRLHPTYRGTEANMTFARGIAALDVTGFVTAPPAAAR